MGASTYGHIIRKRCKTNLSASDWLKPPIKQFIICYKIIAPRISISHVNGREFL